MKRFRRSLHRVSADGAVHMQIDESGCKKIAREIDHFLALVRRNPLCDFRDLPLGDPQSEAVRDAIGKNKSAVGEDHLPAHNCPCSCPLANGFANSPCAAFSGGVTSISAQTDVPFYLRTVMMVTWTTFFFLLRCACAPRDPEQPRGDPARLFCA